MTEVNDHAAVVIIGAGPAGLTAALELARAGITNTIVLEASDEIGGISRTIKHGGNRIDIGGHRFFSKDRWVMDRWQEMMPLAPIGARGHAIQSADQAKSAMLMFQGERQAIPQSFAKYARTDHSQSDHMLVRNRLSRIYFGGQFFDYPLRPTPENLMKLGLGKCATFGMSYAAARINQRPENSLEDFFINRFGHALFQQFFREYTEKVWGVPCSQISADWGAQRVKGLSIGEAVKHGLMRMVGKGPSSEHTSLIEMFMYPRLGPGQMWETTAREYERLGGRVLRRAEVVRILSADGKITGIECTHRSGPVMRGLRDDQVKLKISAPHVISTMPIKDLASAMGAQMPESIGNIAKRLQYRDFVTVGVLYRKLRKTPASTGHMNLLPDNWLYIQEPGVKVGRVQVFNNWSEFLVADPENTVWLGLEYFAQEDDALWAMSDDALRQLALDEMRLIGLADPGDALDCVVVRQHKAYPGYFGEAYKALDKVRDHLDGVQGLWLVGRNGQHRYNNQDHSMLTAKAAAEAILAGSNDKSAIWAVNVGEEYHESRANDPKDSPPASSHRASGRTATA